MAAELVQVKMTKSVDFANRGELIWLEPDHGRALVSMGMAQLVQVKEAPDGSGGEGDGESAPGDRRRRKGQREDGSAAG